MRMGRVIARALVFLGFVTRPAAAGDLFTCQTLGGLNSCAGATFWVEEDPELGSLFSVNLSHWSSDLPVRLTAIGFYGKKVPKTEASLQIAPSFWSQPVPAAWSKTKNRQVNKPTLGGFSFFAGASVPVPEGYDFALGGPLFSGDVFQFALSGSLPHEIRWVWRAESSDGSLVLDCFQGPSGRTQCLSGPGIPAVLAAESLFSDDRLTAFALTECEGGECFSAVPEPSTFIMLLTGVALLSLSIRIGRLKSERRM